MIKFTLFNADSYTHVCKSIHINPAFVVSVIETHRQPMGAFSQPVAVIQMHDGTTHTVYDYDRKAAEKIREGQIKPDDQEVRE